VTGFTQLNTFIAWFRLFFVTNNPNLVKGDAEFALLRLNGLCQVLLSNCRYLPNKAASNRRIS
jgi:hypothetical protein